MQTIFKKVTTVVPTKHLNGTITNQQFIDYYLYIDPAKADVAYNWLKQSNCEIDYISEEYGKTKGYYISSDRAVFHLRTLPDNIIDKLTKKLGLVEASC